MKNINIPRSNFIIDSMEILKNWLLKKKIQYIGFEDVKYAISNRDKYTIINTLSEFEQDCLIIGTIPSNTEEHIINKWIEEEKVHAVHIIIYGKNAADDTMRTKYEQLQHVGFETLYIYSGGLFEWLLLQDIYGKSEFTTTSNCKDILKFRPKPCIPRLSFQSITYR